MFWKKPIFTFTNTGGEPYDLLRFAESCSIRQGSKTVGYVQGLTISGTSLSIDHFAVDSSLIGKSAGEDMLRAFAELIKKQAPNIQTMLLDLGRSPSGSNVQKLADARERLLNNVKATNVQQNQIKPDKIVVSGSWDKANW